MYIGLLRHVGECIGGVPLEETVNNNHAWCC